MSSLDLTEFFNDDESNGHRLAEFLQERRGGVQRQKFLYLNSDTERKSLKVQLEKLPQKQIEDNSKNKPGDNHNKAENKTNEYKNSQQNKTENIEIDKTVEEQIAYLHDESDGISSLPTKSPPPPTSSGPVSPPPPTSAPLPRSPPLTSAVSASRNNINSSEPPLSPIIPFITSKPPSSTRSVSPSRPVSPRLSAVWKSGGCISPGDRLRRLSLKRLTTKVHGGRRTLLREFESTVNDENFQPLSFSTPLSQQPIVIPTSPSPSPSSPLETENHKPNTTVEPSPTSTESCCRHTNTLMQTLKRKDEELKQIMEATLQSQSSVSNKMSPLKRTYTIEKGQSPGQVILTPDRPSVDESLPQIPTSSKIMKTAERSANRSIMSIRVKSAHELLNSSQNRLTKSLRQSLAEKPRRSMRRSAIMVEKAITPKKAALPNSSSQDLSTTNVSIIYPTQEPMDIEIPETQEPMDIEVPETQEQPLTENENCIRIESNSTPVVVIPISRSHNQSYMGEPHCCTIITAKSKQRLTKSKSPSPTIVNKNQDIPEDQLKLTDIFTDDDEENLTPKAVSYGKNNNNQAPLNLASSATNARTKRLRKRSLTRRRLQMDRSLLSTETETEPPPAAHTSNNTQQRRRMVKKKLPLNRAPGTPLNGERFAVELQRMSNYEILDLRKRNSMGRVFPISGRKSAGALEEANQKQLQLDDRIEMELLRRSINKSVNNETAKQKENVNITEEYPPVPDQFRDEQDEKQTDSLVDEKSTDRISFKTCKSHLTRKRRAKSVPDVLKQYLEATKLFKRTKKARKSKKNTTKRSLYTQDNSDSKDSKGNSSNEILELQTSVKKKSNISLNKTQTPNKMKTFKKPSLPTIPSPPVSETDQMPELRVISPPPLLTISLGAPIEERENVKVADAEVEPDVEQQIEEFLPPPPPEFDGVSGVSSNNLNIIQTPTEETKIHANDDNDVFKKPLPPPPAKKKSNKKYKKDILLNDMQETQENNPDTTIRRSKRQVSETKPISIFQILYQENLNRRFQAREKQQARLKQKKREARLKKLPTLAEDEVMASLHNDIQILNTKKSSKTKSKTKLKITPKNSNKKQHQRTYEQLESSKINLTTSPPVAHFNNVFDQLSFKAREENSLENPSSLAQQNNKIKKLKVRLKRFETGNLSIANQHSNTASSEANNQLVTVNTTTNTFTSSVSSSSTVGGCNQSNFELISWLKNVTEAESCDNNEKIFKEMRISPASNLSFSTIQGVEYAFYDTDEKASLGYLRFKPGQIKSKKKAKRYNLHFVTLIGQFRITANDKEKCVGVGDMVAIEKSVYYDIENITDDIGILMVIKK